MKEHDSFFKKFEKSNVHNTFYILNFQFIFKNKFKNNEKVYIELILQITSN